MRLPRSSAWYLAPLLLPAGVYELAVRARNAWYARRPSSGGPEIPVVSVGNLAVGGTGKTPLVAWLARRLAGDGLAPAVVSRGYGGTAGPGPLLVSTGTGPRVDARACGDEPHLLAKSLPGVIVIVGSDRAEGVRAAARAGARCVLLDDGFQHRRLARDLDIVLLDGRAPFGNRRLLPAGPLREPPSSLRRAGAVVLTRLEASDAARDAIAAVRATGFEGPVLRSGHRAVGFTNLAGSPERAPERALAFCGIADPQRFRGDLEHAGVVVAGLRAFRDHQPYTRASWEALVAESRTLRVPLVTTEKDLSRLEALPLSLFEGVSISILRIEPVVYDDSALLALTRRVIAAAIRARGA